MAIQWEPARPPLPLSAAACAAPSGKRVLAQAAMVRIILRFLTARELLSFARTARSHVPAVAAELDAQYTSLFDEYRTLNSQFAALRAGRPHVDQLRAISDRVKALGIEMDDKLQVWEEIQRAWDDAGIGEPKPVLTRDESYLG